MSKKLKYLALGLAVCGVVVGILLGINLSGDLPSGNSSQPHKVKLEQAIIDATIEICKDDEVWGIGLPSMRIDYVVGVDVEGALVLHNGNDVERFVTLEYQPISKPQEYAVTGEYYGPAPMEAENWVSINTTNVRLDEMETMVVRINFFVPEDSGIEANPGDKWEFRIAVVGIAIRQYAHRIVVTTGTDDSFLTVTLHLPLLNNDVASVLSMVSEVGEALYVVGYEPDARELTIGGFKDNLVREVALVYEYSDMVVIGYEQRWLITIL